MAINWGEAEKKYGKRFKDYAPSGLHKVKIVGVEFREVGSNGSIIQEFIVGEDDNYKYPKLTHWLSFKNEEWRYMHNLSLMTLLGATEEGAKKNIENCEEKSSKENIVKAYQQTYDRLLAKQPEVEIEVWPDGKYSKADFNNSVRMNRPDDDNAPATPASVADEGEIVLDTDLDIPF